MHSSLHLQTQEISAWSQFQGIYFLANSKPSLIKIVRAHSD